MGEVVDGRSLPFYADLLRLDGRLDLPDTPATDQAPPLVIACSGFLGLRSIHPARFSRVLTKAGFACFSFDYRGYGESGGERNRVIIEEQIRDIRSAAAFASTLSEVDTSKIFLLGWAMGGGLVIDAADELPDVAGLLSINGLYDGLSYELSQKGPAEMAAFRAAIAAEAQARSRGAVPAWADPFDIYPLDPETLAYVRTNLDEVPGYESRTCSFEFAESLLRWSVVERSRKVELPLFLAHGDRNGTHLPVHAETLLSAYGGPVDTYWVPDAGHTEWMSDDDPKFVALAKEIVAWLGRTALSADGE